MPIYEYECNQCGEAFEKMMRFSEADQIPACPHCQSPNTHKKISKVMSLGVLGGDSYGSSQSSCGSSGGFS
jgi:putative FmdB family regulatory protein